MTASRPGGAAATLLNELPAFRSAEEILAHPRFSFARDEFVKEILALYEHKPFLNRLLLEASRTTLAGVIMCLYARYDEADRSTWPTLQLVVDSMAAYQLASPSRVEDLVSRLVKTGYLERRVIPQDRRVRILIPTDKLVAQERAAEAGAQVAAPPKTVPITVHPVGAGA